MMNRNWIWALALAPCLWASPADQLRALKLAANDLDAVRTDAAFSRITIADRLNETKYRFNALLKEIDQTESSANVERAMPALRAASEDLTAALESFDKVHVPVLNADFQKHATKFSEHVNELQKLLSE